jgi:hypothetical protein
MRSEILAKDTPFVAEGQEVEIVCDALAGRSPFVGTVRSVSVTSRGSLLPLTIEIRNGPPEVRPGMTASARILVAATRLGWFQNSLGIASRSELAMHMTLETICAPTPVPHALAAPILPWAIRETAAHLGLVLAVPTLAVVDTGSRKIVYVESGVGMFDGVEVSTGPRFGDYLPILNGLRAGQNVATTGAFLIDAETRLNPSVAASYFGSTGGGDAAPAKPAVPNSDRGEIQEALSKLSAADRALAIKQKLCPVTDEPLGSMGVPPAVKLGDRTVFLCCKGCEAELRRNPAAYLSKLPVR